MATNSQDYSEEGINPMWLGQEQEQLGQTGAWVAPPTGFPVHDPQVFIDSFEAGEFPEALDIPSWQDGTPLVQYPEDNTDFTQPPPGNQEVAVVFQPTLPSRSCLRPEAASFVPQGLQRPRLQLVTSPLQALPVASNPASGAPVSAPAIRVYEPDDMLAKHDPNQPCYEHRRGRANTAPRTMLGHFGRVATAPDSPSGSSDGHLSPLIDQWMDNGQPRMFAQVTSSSNTSVHAASLPSTPSRSRDSSVASSAGGSHICDHCNKRYSTKSKLNHHARCHTPYHLRPHVCDFCTKRFLYRKDLTRHNLNATHSEHQYHCSTCQRSFGRADHLSRHTTGGCRAGGASSPATTSVTQSTPWTIGSSAGFDVPAQPACNDNDLGTPITDFDSSPLYDPMFVPMPNDDPDGMDCDPFEETEAQLPPSPPPLPLCWSNVR